VPCAAAVLLAACAGCVDGTFVCASDAECAASDPANRCEPSTGFCSTVDPSCANSGHRYLPHSGSLSGECVGASNGPDGSLPDGAVGDGPAGDGMSASCPLPQLLVAVEDLSNNANSHGTILRFSLAGGMTAAPVACTTLAPGGLGALPYAINWIPAPSNLIAVASPDQGLQIVDPASSLIVGSNRNLAAPNPLDAAPLQDPSGQQLVVLAEYDAPDSPMTFSDVEAFKLDGTMVHHWFANADLALGDPLGLTAALDPKHFFAPNISSPSVAAYDVDPWTPLNTTYIADNGADILISIYSLSVGSVRRTAWTSLQAGVSGVYDGAWYRDDNNGTPPLGTPIGPIHPKTCVSGVAECDLIGVVPDPTASSQKLLGLCEDEAAAAPVEARYLIRFDASGCTPFFDGNTLASRRLYKLAIAQ
jgi:hypothetical protein